MTEEEWLTTRDPRVLLDALQQPRSDRKLRLFACACGRRHYFSFLSDQCRETIDVAERYADGRGSLDELERHFAAAFRLLREPRAIIASSTANRSAMDAARSASWDSAFDQYTHRPDELEFAVQAAFLRDIFGNPFRPVTLDPRWLTETVLALASAIYAERAFDRLPVLADALEEAGCNHADILAHCRGPGQHVRGCWVIDSILGKE